MVYSFLGLPHYSLMKYPTTRSQEKSSLINPLTRVIWSIMLYPSIPPKKITIICLIFPHLYNHYIIIYRSWRWPHHFRNRRQVSNLKADDQLRRGCKNVANMVCFGFLNMIFYVVSLAKSGDVHQKKVIFSLRNQDLSCSEISGKDLKAKFTQVNSGCRSPGILRRQSSREFISHKYPKFAQQNTAIFSI